MNRSSPTLVRALSNVVEIAGGGAHTCARRSDGALLCWGWNQRGQLGINSTATQPSPTLVPTRSSVVEIAAGQEHTCARRNDAAVFCWGLNTFGQIGDGTMNNGLTPMILEL